MATWQIGEEGLSPSPCTVGGHDIERVIDQLPEATAKCLLGIRPGGSNPASREEARGNASRATGRGRRVVYAKPQGCTVLVNRWHWVTL
jgi:hypothetical protein